MESSVVNANVAHEKPYLERNRSMMCNRYRARAELKSSIPKPPPILRTVEKKNVLRRTESFMSQPACPTRIPVPKLQWEKTCASNGSTITAPNKHKSISCSRNLNSPRSVSPQSKRASRPKTANASMNPYAHVKSKINSKPVPSGLRNQCSPTNDHMSSSESSVEYISLSLNSSVDQCVREAQRCTSRHSKSPVAHLKAKVKRPSRPNSPYRSSNLRSNDTSMEDKHLNNHLDSESYQLSGEDNIQNKGNVIEKQLEKMESSVVNANVAHEKPYLERNRSMMCNRYRARAELKSSIPKPPPILRTVEKKNVLRRTESFMSQPACPTRIPVPKLQWEKTCASNGSTITAPNKHKSISCSRNLNSPRSVSPQSKRASRPKTANASMNPYAHVKSKINSKPVPSGLRNQCSPTNDHMSSSESSVEYISLSLNSSVDQCVREAQRCTSRHSKSPVAHLKAKVKRPSRPNSPYRSSNLRSNDTSMEDKHLNNHLDSESYQLSGEDNIQNKGDVIEKQFFEAV